MLHVALWPAISDESKAELRFCASYFEANGVPPALPCVPGQTSQLQHAALRRTRPHGGMTDHASPLVLLNS
jgi:hypothetical protein